MGRFVTFLESTVEAADGMPATLAVIKAHWEAGDDRQAVEAMSAFASIVFNAGAVAAVDVMTRMSNP
jgi:hypothetical protein